MGKKSVRTKHDNRIARIKIAKGLMNKKTREDIESAPVSRDETKCQKCGFKATYKFHRCPSCDEVQK
jgi:lipopolysaccharide biosynthesis regulator YciM